MTNKLLFLVLALAALAGVAWSSTVTWGDLSEHQVVIHTVVQGETLWCIAKLYSPDVDPRKTVYLIRTINSLDSPIIYPGQEILVPVIEAP